MDEVHIEENQDQIVSAMPGNLFDRNLQDEYQIVAQGMDYLCNLEVKLLFLDSLKNN